MMHKKKLNPLQKLRFLLLPPAMAVVALLSVTSKAEGALLTQGIEEQQQSKLSSNAIVAITGSAQDSVVYFVDGKRTDAGSIKNIDPKTIEKIDVLRGQKAQDIVNDINIKGVIKITTKKSGETSTDDFSNKVEEAYNTGGIEGVANMLSANPENIIYLINGKEEISYEEVQRLNPDEIKAVSFAKDGPSPRMLQKYGERAKNGVVLIFTKQ